jgi:hypothetical protein
MRRSQTGHRYFPRITGPRAFLNLPSIDIALRWHRSVAIWGSPPSSRTKPTDRPRLGNGLPHRIDAIQPPLGLLSIPRLPPRLTSAAIDPIAQPYSLVEPQLVTPSPARGHTPNFRVVTAASTPQLPKQRSFGPAPDLPSRNPLGVGDCLQLCPRFCHTLPRTVMNDPVEIRCLLVEIPYATSFLARFYTFTV